MSSPSRVHEIPADHVVRGPSTEREGPRRVRPQCAWCKRFVKADTPLTAWKSRVPVPNRQRLDDEWNYWARLLCARCAPLTETLWRKNATVGQVLDRRPEGLPHTHPQWQPPGTDSPLAVTAPHLMTGLDKHEKVRL